MKGIQVVKDQSLDQATATAVGVVVDGNRHNPFKGDMTYLTTPLIIPKTFGGGRWLAR